GNFISFCPSHQRTPQSILIDLPYFAACRSVDMFLKTKPPFDSRKLLLFVLKRFYLIRYHDNCRQPLRYILLRRSFHALLLTQAPDAVLLVRRSEEHTSELQSRFDIVCRLLLE